MLNLTSILIDPSCVLKSYCMCILVALLLIWILVDFMSPILAFWLTKVGLHQKNTGLQWYHQFRVCSCMSYTTMGLRITLMYEYSQSHLFKCTDQKKMHQIRGFQVASFKLQTLMHLFHGSKFWFAYKWAQTQWPRAIRHLTRGHAMRWGATTQ